MKRQLNFIIIVFAILIAQSCSNSKIENDWTKDNLKGKVHSYSEISYKAEERFGNIEKGCRTVISVSCEDKQNKYDEKGNIIEQTSYYSDGSIIKKKKYTYNENGHLIEENCYDSDGCIETKTKYKYNEKGHLIEENLYKSDGSLEIKDTYKYNEKGNLIENIDTNQTKNILVNMNMTIKKITFPKKHTIQRIS